MERYKKANAGIESGYEFLKRGQEVRACNVWLDAWEDIKAIMAEEKLKDLSALEKRYRWSEFIMNYVQDLESNLNNAALEERQFLARRVQYCEELIELCRPEDDLVIENARRAIAESHFALGNASEGERLFAGWLAADPCWGWGYIGWADCYHLGFKGTAPDQVKAGEILEKALRVKGLRDRADVIDRAIEVLTIAGKGQRVAKLKQELSELNKPSRNEFWLSTAGVAKIGRNAPCPCGSGKKHKKCCGR